MATTTAAALRLLRRRAAAPPSPMLRSPFPGPHSKASAALLSTVSRLYVAPPLLRRYSTKGTDGTAPTDIPGTGRMNQGTDDTTTTDDVPGAYLKSGGTDGTTTATVIAGNCLHNKGIDGATAAADVHETCLKNKFSATRVLRSFSSVNPLFKNPMGCSPFGRFSSCSYRQMSTLSSWDSQPVTNTIYFSRKFKPEDLERIIDHFQKVPFFTSILSNRLFNVTAPPSGKRAAKNPFWKSVSRMSRLSLSEAAGIALRSLAEVASENHIRGIELGEAICLDNIWIDKKTGKCVFRYIKPKAELRQGPLRQEKVASDMKRLAKVSREIIQLLHPQAVHPAPLSHWLDLMEESQPRIEMIMYHTLFLTTPKRFIYHVTVDQILRKEFSVGDKMILMEILCNIAHLKGLFTIAELHELLNYSMGLSRLGFQKRQKMKEAKAAAAAAAEEAAAAGTALSSGSTAGTALSSGSTPGTDPGDGTATLAAVTVKSKRRRRRRSKKGNQSDPLEGTPAQFLGEAEKKEFLKNLNDGRNVVSFIRDCPVHGCECACKGFIFVDPSMLNRNDIVELVHFVFKDFDHEVLELFHQKGIFHLLNMEALFGEEKGKWRLR
nr:uncharacterized protein LOC127333937 isoform X2 [Lolium perenne]